MMWLLIAILLIVLIISVTKGNKKKDLEMEVLKKDVDPDKKPDNVQSVTDELLKLKALLDDGALTQEEFDAQKKKLLNN